MRTWPAVVGFLLVLGGTQSVPAQPWVTVTVYEFKSVSDDDTSGEDDLYLDVTMSDLTVDGIPTLQPDSERFKPAER